MCETPSNPGTPVTPLDRMKQWVFDKLQKDISLDDPIYSGPKRESLSGPVPKIVISEVATRSPRIPFARLNKPSPLKRTWVNYDLESPATNISPTGAIKSSGSIIRSPLLSSPESNSQGDTTNKQSPTGTGQKTWLNYSAHSPLSFQKSPRANSLPVTPRDEKPRLFWSATCKTDLESPLHKYIQRKVSASSLPLQSPVHGKCQYSGQLESPTSSINSTEFNPTSAHLKGRTNSTLSSFSDGVTRIKREQEETLRLSGSQNDLQLRDVEKNSQALNTISKTTTLTRSWSTNLNASEKSDEINQKSRPETSLNENESKRRNSRRSSILSLLCLDAEDAADDEDSDHSDGETSANTANIQKDADTDDETLQASRGTQYVEKLYKGVPIGGLTSMFDMYKNSAEWGSVKVRFQYFNKSRRFQVSLIRGKKIGHGQDGNLRLYVKVCLMPGKIQVQKGQGFHESHDPVFYETFNFTKLKLGDLIEKRLRVKFYSKLGLFVKAEPLGVVAVPLFNYDLTAASITWLHLRRCGGQREPKGELDEYDFGLIQRDASSLNSDRQISLYCCSVH